MSFPSALSTKTSTHNRKTENLEALKQDETLMQTWGIAKRGGANLVTSGGTSEPPMVRDKTSGVEENSSIVSSTT